VTPTSRSRRAGYGGGGVKPRTWEWAVRPAPCKKGKGGPQVRRRTSERFVQGAAVPERAGAAKQPAGMALGGRKGYGGIRVAGLSRQEEGVSIKKESVRCARVVSNTCRRTLNSPGRRRDKKPFEAGYFHRKGCGGGKKQVVGTKQPLSSYPSKSETREESAVVKLVRSKKAMRRSHAITPALWEGKKPEGQSCVPPPERDLEIGCGRLH